MNENDNLQTNPKKHRIIKPSFYVDEKRRVICESHSQIERIRVLTSLSDLPAFQETQQLEKILTCKTCKHYTDDVCYFPKSEIDKIEQDRLSYTFHCKLCGESIDRPLTIMYSIYNKEKFNVQIPTVCCTCFDSLENNSFLPKARTRIFTLLLSIILSVFISYLFTKDLMTIFTGNIWGIILVGLTVAFFLYLVVRDVRRIIFLFRGRRYYRDTYGRAKQREKGKYVDDYPFD